MTCEPSHQESDVLAEMKRQLEEDRRFFSNKGKEERECWVVSDFLTRLAVRFISSELRSNNQHSKIDIEFRDARFQIKEIPDPNLRRGKEIKETHRGVINAKTLQDTVGPAFSYDVPPVVDAYQLVRDKAAHLAQSDAYSSQKGSLDLLCYVTRTRVSRIRSEDVESVALASLGWRSISYLMGEHAMVIYTASDAPSFLQKLSHGR